MARPGIMLYLDMLEPIRVLPDADKGKLLVAMLEYGRDGTLPQFDGMLALAWGFVQPKLDRDDESYERAMLQRKYAGFCKSRASRNLPKIPFEDWCLMDAGDRERAASGEIRPIPPAAPGIGSDPSATAAPSTATNSTAFSSAAAAAASPGSAAATAESALQYFGGELGKKVVLLSTEQVGDLLEKLGLDAFNFYVEKLADFIIRNDAKVKSHYDTILKWWNEDRGVRPNGGESNVPKWEL